MRALLASFPSPRRFATQVSGYMGASVGFPLGIQLKLRVTRANQSLECPIILSTAYDDWKVGAVHVWTWLV